MRRCDACPEPAVKSYRFRAGEGIEERCYCYLHAAEDGLLDLPVPAVRTLSPNPIAFVLEAIVRAPGAASAEAVCEALGASARERFGNEAAAVLVGWGIREGADFASLTAALVKAGLTGPIEGVTPETFRGHVALARLWDDG